MIGVALFVYRRPELTKRVIDTIKKNGFPKLYIFQDGLKDEKYRKEWNEVTKIISNVSFTEVEVHVATRNKGLANSIVDGMNYVFERHEEAIALEDDVLLSTGYKNFIEKCFDVYRDNDKVTSVCGTGHGLLIPQDYTYDIYFCHRMSSAAFGTWRKYWRGFSRDINLYTEIKADPKKNEFLKKAGNGLVNMVRAVIENDDIETWSLYWGLYQINMLSYQVVPTHGLAINMGLEGGGTNNTKKSHRILGDFDPDRQGEFILPEEIVIDDRIVQDNIVVMSRTTDTIRFNYYQPLYEKWIRMLQDKKSISDYFEQNKIKEIYIYGASTAAGLLYREVNNKVRIGAFLVEERKSDEFYHLPLYEIEEKKISENIPIVVTPSYDLDYIRHLFCKHDVCNEIILIEELFV